ncbi:MAG: DUF3102 domain-containing protein [Oscillospiraceae bacterium]
MNEQLLVRNIDTITVEIKALQQKTLACAVEIGRRLLEAKSLLPHGEWGDWLSERVEFSQSTANNLMKLFKEYGSAESALFGAASNSQALENLSYTKALRLLAVPENEREDFALEHDIESLSTRELEALIRERDEALKAKEAAEKEALEVDVCRALALAEAQERADKLQEKIENSEARAADLNRELTELKNRPIEVAVMAADPADMEKAIKLAKKEAEKEQAKKIKELEKMIADTTAKNDELVREKADAEREKLEAENNLAFEKSKSVVAEQELEAAKKAAAMSDPVTTEFKTLFVEAQRLLTRLAELAKTAGENEKKLDAALDAMLKAFLG